MPVLILALSLVGHSGKIFLMVMTIVRLHVGNLWCVQDIVNLVLVCPDSLVLLVCPKEFSACVISTLLKEYSLNTRTVRGVF